MRFRFGSLSDEPQKALGFREFAPKLEYLQEERSVLFGGDSTSPLRGRIVEGRSKSKLT
jgi:hypothetical protein